MEGSGEVLGALRLLAGLLVPCVALLALLAGLLLLRPRRRRPPTPASCCRCRCPPGRPTCSPGAPSTAGASSARQQHGPPVPPNSPAEPSTGGGTPEGTLGRQHASTQRKMLSCRTAFPTRLHPAPFEYGSSIRCGDRKRGLHNSANFTASRGPGLDSDFGASAGVSLRILSSDSEESPPVSLPHFQQSSRFEWDYYDPSYKQSPQLQPHLPCIDSKQYWL